MLRPSTNDSGATVTKGPFNDRKAEVMAAKLTLFAMAEGGIDTHKTVT